MRKTMLMTVAALAAAELFAIQGTVSTAVESVSGDVKWHARDKKYIIEKGKITKEFKLADVTSLDIPKPAGFDKAVQAVENGQGASAVATLTKIVADYRMLQWDKPAGRYLTLAHLAAGNAQKAYDVCSPIIAEVAGTVRGFDKNLLGCLIQPLACRHNLFPVSCLTLVVGETGIRGHIYRCSGDGP